MIGFSSDPSRYLNIHDERLIAAGGGVGKERREPRKELEMKHWIVTSCLTLAILTTAGLVGLAKPARAASTCEHVAGEFIARSFFFTSATTAVAEASLTGDLTGTVHADYFDIEQHGQGAIATHATHTIATAQGTLVTSDDILFLPDPDPGVVRANSRLTIVAGTGTYEGATGVLHTDGKLNLSTLEGAIGFKGKICLA